MFGFFDIFPKVQHHTADHAIKFTLDANKLESSFTIKELIEQHCPKFRENARVHLHPFLFNGHLQTAYSQYVDNSKILIHYRRSHITYPDRGRGALDYVDVELTKKELSGEDVSLDSLYSKEEDIGKLVLNEHGEVEEFPMASRTRFSKDSVKDVDMVFKSKKPLILFLHGLSGGSQESYVKLLIRQLINVNDNTFDIMVLNSRVCSRCVIKTPRLYNGIWTDDVRYLVNEQILKQNKDKEIYLVGFSLGASVLSNYLAQESFSKACLLQNLKLAIAVSAPWDLYQSSLFLSLSFIGHHIYSPAMTKSLCRLMKNNYSQLKNDTYIDTQLLHDVCYPEKATEVRQQIKYLHQFDNAFTSKMFGFNNHEEYYRFASSASRLHRVRVPLLLISSLDDPIVGPYVPSLQVKQNPYLHMLTTNTGGHVCWFQQDSDQWYTEPVAQLIKAFHNTASKSTIDLDPNTLPRDMPQHLDRVVLPGSYSESLLP